MSLFGNGRVAAATLRARVLQRLGAEPEWIEGDPADDVAWWTSGPATTFFAIEDGPSDAPDLAVLKIRTPVAAVVDPARAVEWCDPANGYATTSRWTVAPGRFGGADLHILQLGCSFVVSPDNRVALEAFATWCVREQIAMATAKMTAGLPSDLGGEPCGFAGSKTGRDRATGNWHDVVHHYDRVIGPGRDLPAVDLAVRLQEAFVALREEMLAEGTGAWFSEDPTGYPLSCEMPATWARSPGGEIRWDGTDPGSQPTVSVRASLTTWGDAGNGLLVSLYGASYHAGSADVVSQLNRLGEQSGGATHHVGAWTRHETTALYAAFLPAALLGEGIDWPVVMRELLLTFARQAQLARRVLFAEGAGDSGEVAPVGFESSADPFGLAWGETGEGRNPQAWYLDRLHELLVGDDGEWAYPARDGFTWWPYEQAQQVTVIPCGAIGSFREVAIIRLATQVRAGVPATSENLIDIARCNATLADSALVLTDDGMLVLAFQQATSEAHANMAEHVRDLAIRQFTTARELAGGLFGEVAGELPLQVPGALSSLGTGTATAHPVSGPRPEPDAWFGQFRAWLGQASAERLHGLPVVSPHVALIAAAGQYALPYRMTARAADGYGDRGQGLDGDGSGLGGTSRDAALEFTWRPSHLPPGSPVDPEIHVTLTPGQHAGGHAWVVRSHVPVTGSLAEKARWCNERNAEILLGTDDPRALMVVGGWGLSADGTCCLTSPQTRATDLHDAEGQSQALAHLLREVESIVRAALVAAPEAVAAEPLTAAGLAAGLHSVEAAFAGLLRPSPTDGWSLAPGTDSVSLTCDFGEIEIPVGYCRPQLALLYASLIPPDPVSFLPVADPFPDALVDRVLAHLARENEVWLDEDSAVMFDAGPEQVRLDLSWPQDAERFGAVPALRVAGGLPQMVPPTIGTVPVRREAERPPGSEMLFWMVLPPAGFAWMPPDTAEEAVAWVIRHVIGQVRDAADLAGLEQAQDRRPPAARRLFSNGRYAAAALRARLLALLGAEPKWLIGDHDARLIIWNSGAATTVFEVTDGAEWTPDLGVLRVYTPVAVTGNGNTARDVCEQLNERTGTARWSVTRESVTGGGYDDEVQVSCAFVVGPHNQDLLESFALWCVREQVAVATTHIRSGDVAEAVGGVASRYVGFPAGDERPDLHPVTAFLERDVLPSATLSAGMLADELLAAFGALRSAMRDENTSTWFSLLNDGPLTCETPFSWDPYPDLVITRMRADEDEGAKRPPTALLESAVTEHPDLGNGLLITVHVPRDPRGHVGRAINAISRLDVDDAPGASHSLGGWAMSQVLSAEGQAPGCTIFLPAAFAELVGNRPLVMREILLTLTRQALLSRRVLVPAEQRAPEDHDPAVGLAVAADPLATSVRGPHGLAWGETGEGRNPAARVLDQIYRYCVGPDVAWADTRADGFTWWPYRQAQHVTATLHGSSDVVQGVSVRITTEVRRGVPATPAVLAVIAKLNAELGQSALVLGADGLLALACQLYVHEGTDHWANRWAQTLSAEQFIAARDLSARLADLAGDLEGFGDEALSEHPFSGPRPEPDGLLSGIRENGLIEAASNVRAGLDPLVPLLGLCRLYSLPVDMTVPDQQDALGFTWHLQQSVAAQATGQLPTGLPDAAVRVSVRHADIGSGPGWLIRSVVPVAGDNADKALWCNQRNAELLGTGADTAEGNDSGLDRTMVGGWGLTPDGECCLTTWLTPSFVTDELVLAAGLIGNVLSYHASLILAAAQANPGSLTGSPITTEELARGLSSVLTSLAGSLKYPDDFGWSVEAAPGDVVVTLTGPADGDVTVLRVPLTRNRPALGWLYSQFLGRSTTRVRAFGRELIPGETWDWAFTLHQIWEGLGVLDDEGLLDWVKECGAFTFYAGSDQAWLRYEQLPEFRRHGAMGLRLSATVPARALRPGSAPGPSDATTLGTWTQAPSGVTYTVTIPPVGMLLGNDLIVQELVTWTARHVITHVRDAPLEPWAMPSQKEQQGQEKDAGQPGLSWHDHGDGTAAIMAAADLVAAFHAKYVNPDEYGKNPVPDRSGETRRSVEESGTSLATSPRGKQKLMSWVARKWEAQLDSWWMYGEPVFWCEHIDSDADDNPLMEWFMRFPAAMSCDQCADHIRAALPAEATAVCDSCAKESDETTSGRTPGLSIIANYELCHACADSFTDLT